MAALSGFPKGPGVLMSEQGTFWSSWGERLSALRNIPPVLKIVWRSGPAVVSMGLILRVLASFLPLGLLAITKLIIDAIVGAVAHHQPVQPRFWWLVGAEFGLAVAGTILARIIDFLDALFADKYTRHVSIEVMRHASQLDLVTYEDPAFYDRLERARVQATDRLGMIQSWAAGAADHHHDHPLGLDHDLLAVADAVADRRRGAGVSGGKSLCLSRLCQEFPSDTDPP